MDTNVLVYLYSENEPAKSKKARQCLEHENIWISTQVLNELSNVLCRKFKISYLDILNVMQELEASFQITVVTPTIRAIALNFKLFNIKHLEL